MGTRSQPPRTYNQNHVPRKYAPGKTKGFHLLDLELSVGSQPGPTEIDNRFSTMTEVRRVAWPEYEGTEWDDEAFPARNRGHPGVVPSLHALVSESGWRSHWTSGRRIPAN